MWLRSHRNHGYCVARCWAQLAEKKGAWLPSLRPNSSNMFNKYIGHSMFILTLPMFHCPECTVVFSTAQGHNSPKFPTIHVGWFRLAMSVWWVTQGPLLTLLMASDTQPGHLFAAFFCRARQTTSEEIGATFSKLPVDWQVYESIGTLFRSPVLHKGLASHRHVTKIYAAHAWDHFTGL